LNPSLVHQSGTLSMVLRMAPAVKRGSIYWLRKKVPDDLRPLVGKREEKFSLKTRDSTEAKILLAKAVAEIDERWSNLRHGRISPSHKQAWTVAGEIYGEFVAAHEDNTETAPLSHRLLASQVRKPDSFRIITARSGPELTRRMLKKIWDLRRNPKEIQE
jgi:hypothetical protein